MVNSLKKNSNLWEFCRRRGRGRRGGRWQTGEIQEKEENILRYLPVVGEWEIRRGEEDQENLEIELELELELVKRR